MLDRAALALLRPGLDAAAQALAAARHAGRPGDVVSASPSAWPPRWRSRISTTSPASRCCSPGDSPTGSTAHRARDARRPTAAAFSTSRSTSVFYASIPLAFAFADPARNALAAARLARRLHRHGASFLAFAALAAQRGLQEPDYPNKGIYYLGGLTEGTETIRASR